MQCLRSSGSRVQAQETTFSNTTKPSYRQHLMQGDKIDMEAAESAYIGSDKCDGQKKLVFLRACRTDAWFIRHKVTGEVRVNSSTCKLRWCPICSKAKTAYAAKQVSEWIPKQAYPKFMTLTLQHSNHPVVDQVDELYNHFRALRKLKWFRDRCTGGVWFFQMKLSKKDDRWHPHLHCIVTGKYLPRNKLAELWKKVTSGSYILDIQMVKDHTNAANEVARYCAQPVRLAQLYPHQRSEILDAFYGRRLCGTWGRGRDLSFRPVKQDDADQWQNLGSWTYVVNLAESDSRARAILFAYKTGDPLPNYEPLTDYLIEVPEDYEHPPPDNSMDQLVFDYCGV